MDVFEVGQLFVCIVMMPGVGYVTPVPIAKHTHSQLQSYQTKHPIVVFFHPRATQDDPILGDSCPGHCWKFLVTNLA